MECSGAMGAAQLTEPMKRRHKSMTFNGLCHRFILAGTSRFVATTVKNNIRENKDKLTVRQRTIARSFTGWPLQAGNAQVCAIYESIYL